MPFNPKYVFYSVITVLVLILGNAIKKNIELSAIADVVQQNFRTSLIQIDSLSKEVSQGMVVLQEQLSDLSTQNVELQRQIAELKVEEEESFTRYVDAGASLAATHDSLLVLVPLEVQPVVQVAIRQHMEEQEAGNATIFALRGQLTLKDQEIANLNSSIVLLNNQLSLERELNRSQGASLVLAQQAISSYIASTQQNTWKSVAFSLGKYLVYGYVMYELGESKSLW